MDVDAARFLLVLALAGTMGGFAAAQQEDDPHYQPVAAVGDREFAVSAGRARGILRYFATGSLEGSAQAERAVINIPGLLRNSDVYQKTVENAVTALGEPPEKTLAITPQFLAAIDVSGHRLPPETLRWDVQTWLDGSPAIAPAPLGAFRRARCSGPAARRSPQISRAHNDRRDRAFRGRAARATLRGGRARSRKRPWCGHSFRDRQPVIVPLLRPVAPAGRGALVPFDAADCAGVNRWKYGFEAAPPYVRSGARAAAAYEERYAGRRVAYLLGELDIDPKHPVLDTSCAAQAQGAYRLVRGLNYVRYMRWRRPAGLPLHEAFVIAGVAHDARRMFTSPCGLAVIFDRPRTACQSAAMSLR